MTAESNRWRRQLGLNSRTHEIGRAQCHKAYLQEDAAVGACARALPRPNLNCIASDHGGMLSAGRRFKGLERPVVVIPVTPDTVIDTELPYVALSRARAHLEPRKVGGGGGRGRQLQADNSPQFLLKDLVKYGDLAPRAVGSAHLVRGVRAAMDGYAIWQKGILLSEAWLYFARPSQQAAYRRLWTEHGTKAYLRRLIDYLDNCNGAGTDQAVLSTPPPMPDFAPLDEQRERLQSQILVGLRTGKLLAYGFGRAGDGPIPVPEDLWGGDVDWQKSQVVCADREFSAIRVLSRAAVGRVGKKAGPTTRKTEIEQAYEDLKQRRRLDFSKSLASHIALIRTHVVAMSLEGSQSLKGLGDQTIRRTLRLRYAADREAQGSHDTERAATARHRSTGGFS